MSMIEADRWSEFATKDDLHQMVIHLVTWMLVGQATLVAMVGVLILFAV